MRQVIRALTFVLVGALAGPSVHAAEIEQAAGSAGQQLLIVFDADRHLALVPEGTVLPKGLKVAVQDRWKEVPSGDPAGIPGLRGPGLRPLVFGYAETRSFEAAREEARTLGLMEPDRQAQSATNCVDVLLYLAPNIFHRAINCSGTNDWVLYSYATTRLGTTLKNTNADPFHTISWYCIRPNQVCTLFTDTTGYGGIRWTRSEAWVESIYLGHGPDFGEDVTYYSSISF